MPRPGAEPAPPGMCPDQERNWQPFALWDTPKQLSHIGQSEFILFEEQKEKAVKKRKQFKEPLGYYQADKHNTHYENPRRGRE